MGCVGFTDRYFPGGEVSEQRMAQAETAAMLEIRPMISRYREIGWERVVGSSGTIIAVSRILEANGWDTDSITPRGLRKLRKAMIAAGRINNMTIAGLTPERAPVFPGGVAILSALMEGLEIAAMRRAGGALREGLIYDLLGRLKHEDAREQTVLALVRRYGIDQGQAKRVEHTVLALWSQVRESWSLDQTDQFSAQLYLRWAALLHEIGLSLAYAGYHKHGAYLIENSDLPGFARRGQQLLGILVRGHRRRFPKTEITKLPAPMGKLAARLCILLRLGVCLHRSRNKDPLPELRLTANKNKVNLALGADWLARHHLLQVDLSQESTRLHNAGFDLTFD
jgi:exopolyphosphatase/guanosine-5'-triphosphate,3'-diphosphate pyrophosphatase